MTPRTVTAPGAPPLAISGATPEPGGAPHRRVPRIGPGTAALLLALAIWIAPVATDLALGIWSTDQGAQGPLVLATGAWLLVVRQREQAALARPGRFGVSIAALAACLLLFVLARMMEMIAGQLLAVWLAGVTLLYAQVGARGLRGLAFPLGYLLFLIPPPFFIAFPIVRALKLWIASGAVGVAATAGIEAASSGNAVFVDQYELSIEAACAGLNSLFSLLALGTFYVYLRHGANWRYAALLLAAVPPLAIGANLLRVVILVAGVHLFGSAILDTVLHVATGLVTALAAMILLVALDRLATPVERRLRARGAAGATA